MHGMINLNKNLIMGNTTPNICRRCGGTGTPSNGIVNYHDIQTSDTRKEFITNMQDCLKCEKCGHSWVPPISLIDGIPLVPFRVKITRCSSEGAWYRRRVGEEFSVGPHPEESDLYVVWEDIIDKSSKFLRGILIKDCEVIIPMENIAKPYEPKETTPKTAEEFIKEGFNCDDFQFYEEPTPSHIAEIMTKYARQECLRVALQVRAECAEKAKVRASIIGNLPVNKEQAILARVDKNSILSVDIEQFINK